MTALTLAVRAAKERVKLASLPRVNWKVIYLLGISIALLMVISYIFLINQLTEGVYLIKKYNKEVNSLYAKQEILENNFAEIDFMQRVISKTTALSFEKTKEIRYVEIIGNSIAKAE